jgi:glycosyltransferase involved in cell wall biosynthesis
MVSLSVVIITYNEEKNISRCIDSARPVADEIVVLDSYSTDRTEAIVRESGGRFCQQAFTGYGAQKNAATALATHNYVLFLDADELLSPALQESIRAEKEKGFPSDGYTMNRLNNYCGRWIRHGSWYPDKKVRLLNRQKGAWSLDIVHESLVPDAQARISHLRGDLLHYTYFNAGEHMEKNNKYSTLSARLLFQKGRRSSGYKIALSPFWAFFTSYFLRAGFLDGLYGFVIAINIAHLTFLKYIKLYQLQQGAAGGSADRQ